MGIRKRIFIIFMEYEKQKEYEISFMEKRKKVLRNQVPWIYNANHEAHLLQEILDEKYFQLDRKNLGYIFDFHIGLLKLNFLRAKLAGYSKISFNRYDGLLMNVGREIFDVSEWKDTTIKIYKRMDNERRQALVYRLYINFEQDFDVSYCNECIKDLIIAEMDGVFDGKREQKDFVNIFGQIINEKHFNDFCTQVVKDKNG